MKKNKFSIIKRCFIFLLILLCIQSIVYIIQKEFLWGNTFIVFFFLVGAYNLKYLFFDCKNELTEGYLLDEDVLYKGSIKRDPTYKFQLVFKPYSFAGGFDLEIIYKKDYGKLWIWDSKDTKEELEKYGWKDYEIIDE